jgi:hypothetical protein
MLNGPAPRRGHSRLVDKPKVNGGRGPVQLFTAAIGGDAGGLLFDELDLSRFSILL